MRFLLFIIVSTGVLIACDSSAQNFTDVSREAGIHHQFVPFEGTFGGGAAVLDINNDGFEDLFIAGGLADDVLYLNNKDGTFTNIFSQSGIKTKVKYVTQGAVSADVNKDGRPDLFITTITTTDPKNVIPRACNLLFLNTGNGKFRNATEEYGLDKFLTFSTGAAFGDVNNDDYPDLFVSNYFKDYTGQLNIMNDAMVVNSGQSSRSMLFINVDGERFKEAAADYTLNFKAFSFGGSFTDFDNDGDLDLMVINDFGYKATPNMLFENMFPANYFKDVSTEMNMNLGINGMGVANGDINQDGLLDYFFTNIRSNQFLVSQGKGKPFANKSANIGTLYPFSIDSLGNRAISVSWGCNFADFDNDSDLDIFAACGSLNPNVEPNPDCYFENNNGLFVNKALEKGLYGAGMGRGSVVFDYDNDGDEDLLVIGQKPVYRYNDLVERESVTHLFRNDLKNEGNWIEVRLNGSGSDTKGIGSRVTVVSGNQKMIREVDGGSSHLSQNSSVLHFGLGPIQKFDSLIVRWMGGTTQVLVNLSSNQIVSVYEPPHAKSVFGSIAVIALTLAALVIAGLYMLDLYRKKRQAI